MENWITQYVSLLIQSYTYSETFVCLMFVMQIILTHKVPRPRDSTQNVWMQKIPIKQLLLIFHFNSWWVNHISDA